MAYSTDQHHRRSIRLRGYDHRQAGAYFVTFVVQDRLCLFGHIVGEEMRRNAIRELVAGCWRDLPKHFSLVVLDEFVVVPNHFHGILLSDDGRGEAFRVGGGRALVGGRNASPYGWRD